MRMFETKRLPVDRNDVAPDGSDVRILLGFREGAWLILSFLLAKHQLQ
jgi:hypothetical protein